MTENRNEQAIIPKAIYSQFERLVLCEKMKLKTCNGLAAKIDYRIKEA